MKRLTARSIYRFKSIFMVLILLANTACSDEKVNDTKTHDEKAPTNVEALSVKPMTQKAPPFPTYQMREEVVTDQRLVSQNSGAVLFSNLCGSCHLLAGMGTNVLTGQRVALGEKPEMGLLVNRQDLHPDYIRSVVRNGKNSMPRLSRVDITDAELTLVANFLTKNK